MTIKNREAFDRATTDWGPLEPALKPGTAIIDLDGVHDCNGRVLVIETKPWPFEWKSGNFGQLALLEALAMSKNYHGVPFTVLILYLAEPGNVESVAAIHQLSPTEFAKRVVQEPAQPATFNGLIWWLRGWSGVL